MYYPSALSAPHTLFAFCFGRVVGLWIAGAVTVLGLLALASWKVSRRRARSNGACRATCERQSNLLRQMVLAAVLVLAAACSNTEDPGSETATGDVCGHLARSMQADNSQDAPLVVGDVAQNLPAWSPDGESIACTEAVRANLESAPSDTCRPLVRESGDGYGGSIPMPAEQDTDRSDRTTPQWVPFAAVVLGALAIVAVVADLARRRWRRSSLEAALESSDPDELTRTAGLLGDRFARQDRTSAAEHAYRAAIDASDEYWSPIAQVVLAELLSQRGDRAEAQALLEAAIASGHPRAVPAAQTSLDQLRTGNSHTEASNNLTQTYEALG